MRYAILSDVHANLEALERVLADAKLCGAERIVCLGDVVGYGPQPAETLARIRAVSSLTLLGNHDAAACGRISSDGFIDLAADAVSRHRAELSTEARVWLRGRALVGTFGGARAAHGDLSDPAMFNYADVEEIVAENFAATSEPLLFVGHTHVPEVFVCDGKGDVTRFPPQDFKLTPGDRYLVNVGSVGYPRERDGRCLSSYVIYDDVKKTVLFRFLPFSVSSVMQRGARRKTRGRLRRIIGLCVCTFSLVVVSVVCLWKRAPVDRPSGLDPRMTDSASRATESLSSVLAKKTVTLGSGLRTLKANVKITGTPVLLKISYRNAADELLSHGETMTVKRQSHRKFKVPPEATVATLELLKLDAGDTPNVLLFSPEVVRMP